MPRFVIDEDMPRSTARALSALGYEAVDVRDHGLRGASDEQVYQFAQSRQAVLITIDTGFGNILRFPIGTHFGIVIGRFPNELTSKEINQQLVQRFEQLTESDFKGNLIVIEPGRARIRRKQ